MPLQKSEGRNRESGCGLLRSERASGGRQWPPGHPLTLGVSTVPLPGPRLSCWTSLHRILTCGASASEKN